MVSLSGATTIQGWLPGKKIPFLPEDAAAAVIEELQELRVCSECPQVNGFDIGAYCKPAKILGGDFFDFIPLDDRRVAIVVADVAGKGTASAILMSMVHNALQACAPKKTSPTDILLEMNDFVLRYTRPQVFVTMLLAILDSNERSLSLCRAGHESLIYLPYGNGNCRMVAPEGIALGMASREVFSAALQQEHIHLSTGDVLLLYTDGVTEAVNAQGEFFSLERLVAVAQKTKSEGAESTVRQIFSLISEFEKDVPQHDDQTLVIVSVRELSEDLGCV